MTDYKQKLNELLLTTAKQNASDLHLAVGRRPTIRVDSVLIPLAQEPILTKEEAEGLVFRASDRKSEKHFSKTSRWTSLSIMRTRLVSGLMFISSAVWAWRPLRLIPAQIKTIEVEYLPLMHDFVKTKPRLHPLVVGPCWP